MADAVRRDTGALNIIETSCILPTLLHSLLCPVINIEAYRILYHLNGINARAKSDSNRFDKRQAACSHTTRKQ